MLMLLKTIGIACMLAGLVVLPLIYLCHQKRIGWNGSCCTVVMLLMPVALFFCAIGMMAVNVPFWDDYDAIIRYVCLSPEERFKQLFALHNQHRIVTVRLFIEGMVALSGKVNFKACMVFGSMQLIVIFACFCFLYVRQFGRCLGVALVFTCGWLLFSLHNFENAFWALTALQNLGVIMWAFLAIICFHFRSRLLCHVAAWVCVIVASLTSVQGLAILAIFLLMLFLPPHDDPNVGLHTTWNGLIRQTVQRVKTLWICGTILGCITIVIVASAFYMNGYSPGDVELRSAATPISDKMLYVLAFLGNPFLLYPIAIVAGSMVIVVFGFITVRFTQLPRLMRPVFFFALFLLACDVAGVNFRAESPYAGLCYRYYIIVACLYASLLGLVFSLIRANASVLIRLSILTAFCCIAFCLTYALLFLPQIQERSESLRVNLLAWPQHKEGLRYEVIHLDDASKALEQLESMGLYDHTSVRKRDDPMSISLVPWAELHFP